MLREDHMCGRDKKREKAVPTIVSEPSESDLRPSEEAKEEIRHLIEWEEESKQRDWVVGRPCK